MKFKKTLSIFTFIITVAIIYSFKKNGNVKHDKLTLTASVYKQEIIDSVKYLSIKTTLTNNSSDTFNYIIPSCYYPFFYKIVPNDFILPTVEDCNKNTPELVSIPPHKNIEIFISLRTKQNSSQLHDTAFRIGIYLTTVNDFVDMLRWTHILSINPNGVNSKEYEIYSLSDTSYKIGVNFMTEKSGIVKQFDKLVKVNLLWSNTIKLSTLQ